MKLKDLHRGANGTGGTPLVRTFSKGGLGQFDPAPRRAYHRSAGWGSEVRFPAVSCFGIIVHFVPGTAFGLDISLQRKGGSLLHGAFRAKRHARAASDPHHHPDLYDHPRRPSERAFGIVVVVRSLLDRAVLRLLHGFGQRNAAAGGFGEIAGAQAVGGKRNRIKSGLGDAPLEDQVDGRVSARFSRLPQRSMRRKTAPSVIPARSSQPSGPEQAGRRAARRRRCQPVPFLSGRA